jgi:hypothetical protein
VIAYYSYQVNGFCDRGFICTGDAHRFVDPIFSFGLTVTMPENPLVAPINSGLPGMCEPRNAQSIRRSPTILRDGHRRPARCPGFLLGASFILRALRLPPVQRAHNRHVCRSNLCAPMAANPALLSSRKLLNREGEREQSYKSSDLYSIPIGSRYHPQRAAIWRLTRL